MVEEVDTVIHVVVIVIIEVGVVLGPVVEVGVEDTMIVVVVVEVDLLEKIHEEEVDHHLRLGVIRSIEDDHHPQLFMMIAGMNPTTNQSMPYSIRRNLPIHNTIDIEPIYLTCLYLT